MSSYLRLLLVRHGQVAANRELRYIGRRDEPLTALGLKQAARLGEAIAELSISKVLSSPLERAQATARQIAEASGLSLETEPRLVEQAYGEWEGKSREELSGVEALGRFDRDATAPPPQGESLLAVEERVVELVEELAAEAPAAAVVLVTHVGPIKALLARALGITLQQTRRFFLDPATITVVDWGRPPLLRLFNAHGHLGWTRAEWMKAPERCPGELSGGSQTEEAT